jgi:hypothetical protein
LSFLESRSGFDVTRPNSKFPVIEAAPLEPVSGRWFRAARRQASDLPVLVDGSVHVFQINDQFALAPAGRRMLRSAVAAQATMVAVVLIQSQVVPAVAVLPSTQPGRRVLLRAGYYCKVEDPVRVLEAGCWDVRAELLNHLLADAQLRMLGAREDIGSNPEVAQRIMARVLARDKLDPPFIPGMRIKLMEVSPNVQYDADAGPVESWPDPDVESTHLEVHDRFGDDDDEPPRDSFGSHSDEEED